MRSKVKNKLTAVMIILCFFVVAAVSVSAIFALTQQRVKTDVDFDYQTPSLDALTFTASSVGDSYSITKCNNSTLNGTTGVVVIPKVYNDKPITEISASAFSGCTNLKEVIIQDNITSIGERAFSGCTGLTSISIPSSVTSIGGMAFYYCTGLTSVEIPESITSIGNATFYMCTSLASIEIPSSITSIGNAAFESCTGLTNIEIPSSVTSIGNAAFYGCSNLQTATFITSTGWFVASSESATSGTNISSADLSNTSTAATYLKTTYYNNYWKRV